LPKNHNLGLGTGAIVFYDLTLAYGSLFSDFLGNDLIIDFWPFWPYTCTGKFDDFKECKFSPQK
jgi:hypothetical protein